MRKQLRVEGTEHADFPALLLCLGDDLRAVFLEDEPLALTAFRSG
jgi:hypothetical protein